MSVDVVVCVITPHRQALRAPGADQRRAVLASRPAAEATAWRLPAGQVGEGEEPHAAALRIAKTLLWSPASILLLSELGEVELASGGADQELAAGFQLEGPRSLSKEWSVVPESGAVRWAWQPIADLELPSDQEAVRPLLERIDWTYWHRRRPPRIKQPRAGDGV